jgi:adenylate kinase
LGEKLLIFGPPGVGKGTQAVRLASALRVAHISTGDMLRTAIQSHTPLGGRVRQYLESGQLVPDETVVDVVRERLRKRDAQAGFILDGFPRTVWQAARLSEVLGGHAPPALDAVIVLHAPTDALVARLSGRRICSSCQASYHLTSGPPKIPGFCDRCGSVVIQRSDDTEDTVRFRQQEYASKTQPVIDYFAQNGWPVQTVDAIGDIEQVFGRIYAALLEPVPWAD